MNEIKEKIRPVFQELQGYLSQLPLAKDTGETIYDDNSWNQVNTCIDELNTISQKDYNKFKLIPQTSQGGGLFLRLFILREKLGGLIDRLHAEYFSDDDRPFGSKPSTIVTQSQFQEQNINLTMILQIQEKVIEKLNDPDISSTEKSFLEKVKAGLTSVKSVIDLINLIFVSASSVGLAVDNLMKLFGK